MHLQKVTSKKKDENSRIQIRIRIQIHTEMSWIRNTAFNKSNKISKLSAEEKLYAPRGEEKAEVGEGGY